MTSANKQVGRIQEYHDFTNPSNKTGLAMHIVRKGDTVESEFRIPSHMAGWRSPTVVGAHPGAVDTALATVTGQGAMALSKCAAMIKSTTTEYFDLVPVDTVVRATAKAIRKRGDNELVMEGQITGPDGQVLAHCSATYALYTPPELRARALCGEKTVGEFERVLAAL